LLSVPVQTEAGWPALFHSAFRQSRNPMALVDEARRTVDVNGAFLALLGHRREALLGRPISELVVGGPRMTDHEWHVAITTTSRATGEGELRRADGSTVGVQFAATVEVATGPCLALFVVQSVSRWDTVRTQVRNVMGKAGARSRAHLVAKAIGEGLVTA
jgi:PAS domain S-box-containing protein